VIVVKLGGSAPANSALGEVCADIADLMKADERVVIVHGGSAELARLAARMGVELRYLTAPDGVVTRYTNAATLELLTLALAGMVKPALVAELTRHGVAAVGITGFDAGVLRARRKRAVRTVSDGKVMIVRDDHSGRITNVDATVLDRLLDCGLVPVLSPPALDEDGRSVNVNADRVASAVAVALAADCLVFLTDVPGVLRDPDEPASVVPRYHVAERSAVVRGGMGIKLVAAGEALAGGVRRVFIASGHRNRPVASAQAGRGGTEVILAAIDQPDERISPA